MKIKSVFCVFLAVLGGCSTYQPASTQVSPESFTVALDTPKTASFQLVENNIPVADNQIFSFKEFGPFLEKIPKSKNPIKFKDGFLFLKQDRWIFLDETSKVMIVPNKYYIAVKP